MKYWIYMWHSCWCIIFGCLEFKFKFEFYLLNPFQTQTLIPKTLYFFPFYSARHPCQPSRPQRPNPAPQPSLPRSRKPALACGPAGLLAQPARLAAPAAPRLHPGSLTRGSRPSSLPRHRPRFGLHRRAAESGWARLLCVARTPRNPRPGHLSRRRLPGRPTREPEPPPLEPHAPETLTRAAAFGFLPPSPLCRQGAIPELRKEVRSSPVPLIVVPVHRVAEEGSPEFAAAPSRAAAWSAVAVAT
jgi:hypothetical protein